MKPWVASRLDALSVAVRRPGHVKVPEVTVYFWVTKVLTTAMGESTSDGLVHQLGPGIAVPLAGLGLAASLVLQFRTKGYVPWVYWLAVVMVAIFGTMAADVLHKGLGSPTPPRRRSSPSSWPSSSWSGTGSREPSPSTASPLPDARRSTGRW
jgi:hypothetical protein